MFCLKNVLFILKSWIFHFGDYKRCGKSTYQVIGVGNAEKLELDFVGILRSQTKFNILISVKVKKYSVEDKIVLAFYIPSSPIKPVYFNNNLSNTFVRTGSGDQHATEMEILAIQRDQAFGSRSEIVVPYTSYADINQNSLQTYRRRVQQYNDDFLYNSLSDEEFCNKLAITKNGCLTYGSLLMFGTRDAVQNAVSNFWIDYIEIPGMSYKDAVTRYTYRMQEQDNIWEYYQLLIQRLRIYVDNPFTAGPDGFAPDDNSQLYTLREGLINMLAHADYFSPMHSTIRVYSNRIEFQNAGRLTGKDVLFESELTHSNVIYMLPDRGGVANPTSTRQVPDKYPTSTRQVPDKLHLYHL